MLLALDYDDTYTRDPEFWNQVIALAVARGHSVICVTARDGDCEIDRGEVERDLAHQVEAILFTAGKAKWPVAYDAGFMPSVWIDDQPNWIQTGELP